MKPSADLKSTETDRLHWERKTIRKLIEIHPEFRPVPSEAKARASGDQSADNVIPFPSKPFEADHSSRRFFQLRVL